MFPVYRELFRSPGFGRSPELLLITCADSGIDPNLITQTDPGELIVCSNLGNVIPPFGSRPSGEWACIEYALSVLGVQHIAVCGHTDCGAIKALLNLEESGDMPEVASWMSHGRSGDSSCDGQSARSVRALTEANVLHQFHNIGAHPLVSRRLKASALELHAWFFEIANGRVLEYSFEQQKFVSIVAAEKISRKLGTRG